MFFLHMLWHLGSFSDQIIINQSFNYRTDQSREQQKLTEDQVGKFTSLHLILVSTCACSNWIKTLASVYLCVKHTCEWRSWPSMLILTVQECRRPACKSTASVNWFSDHIFMVLKGGGENPHTSK